MQSHTSPDTFFPLGTVVGAVPNVPDVTVPVAELPVAELPVTELPVTELPTTEPKDVRRALPRPPASLLPPKPKDTRFLCLDAFRGLACLMLLVYHATFYAPHSWRSGDPSTWTVGGLAINLAHRCWMGVPLFFVVSGYCIAASIDSLRRRPHSLTSYFYRRFRRIYPPLWAACFLAIGFTAAVGLHPILFDACLQLPRMSQFSAWDWFGNATATTSWLARVLGVEPQYLMPNTWTLCYEEQFYAVTGLVLVFASRRFFVAAYGITLATLLVRHLGRAAGVPVHGFFFDGHWLLFAAGLLLYEYLSYFQRRGRAIAVGAWSVGMVYGLAERLWASDPADQHLGEYLFVACAFALFLTRLKRWDQQITRQPLLRPLFWCGQISYSIYLTHYPLTVLVACVLAMGGVQHDGLAALITVPVSVLLSLPVAWLFHWTIERHFINAPVAQTPPPPAPRTDVTCPA